MGNSLISELSRKFNSSNNCWQVVSTTSYSSKLREKKTGLVGQRYKIDFKDVELEYEIYMLRYQYSQHLVAVYDIRQEQNKNLCALRSEVSVIIEDIPYRLADLGAISFEEGLYIMSCVLRACEVLKRHEIDFYMIDETNICFNHQGQCKYWINENLYRARPISARKINQKLFILSLWEIIEQRVNEANSFFHQDLSQLRQINLQAIKKIVDKALTVKLVAMPSICNLHTDVSPSVNLFLEQESLIKVSSKQQSKKVSLSNYNSKRYRQVQTPRPRKVSEENLRKQVKSSPQKISLGSNRQGLSKLHLQVQENYSNMKIRKTNTTSIPRINQTPPIDPFHSEIFIPSARKAKPSGHSYLDINRKTQNEIKFTYSTLKSNNSALK